MNACGRDLSCADMVGNFILMPLDRDRQERLYADHLYPIEYGFDRHGGEDHFEAFIRHYLKPFCNGAFHRPCPYLVPVVRVRGA